MCAIAFERNGMCARLLSSTEQGNNERPLLYKATLCFVMPPSLVPVGQASVMVAVSAEHRREAIEAVSYGIDAVKSVAAIWKKVCGE